MWKDADKPDGSQTIYISAPSAEALQASNLTEQDKQDLLDMPNITQADIQTINRHFNPYIFYKKNKKEDYECFCTHCNSTFYASAKKHGEFEHCPNCGKQALIVSANYPQKGKYQSLNFVIFKFLGNTVYALCIWVDKTYCPRQFRSYNWGTLKLDRDFQRQPDLRAGVTMIYVFKPGGYAAYTPDWSSKLQDYTYRKVKKKIPKPFHGYMYYSPSMIYINKNFLNHRTLKYYYEALPSRNYSATSDELIKWLCLCSFAPMTEIAIKSGSPTLRKIVYDRLDGDCVHSKLVNWKAKRPKDFLKIPYSDLKRYGLYLTNKGALGHVDLTTLEFYAAHYKKGEKVSFELCEFEQDIINCRIDKGYIDLADLKQVKELFEYKKRQVKNGTWHSLGTYVDYLDHAKDCGYDIKQNHIRFPRNLRQAHDDAVENWAIICAEKEKAKAEAEAKKYNYPKRYKKLVKNYSFEYGDLMIVVPKSASEIIDEGRILQHCVGGYASRHIQGQTTILFLRHISEPDKPYYTIEVDEKEKHIVQCHGFMNEWKSKKAEEVKAFEKEFAKFIKNPKKYKAERKSEEQCRKSA